MTYNGSIIPHYDVERIELQVLKNMVKISRDHLREKSTWYDIEGALYYFKERNDVRSFNEIFCKELANILGLESADYSMAYISEQQLGGKKGESHFGLLSRNYQQKDKNYYLASDLMDSQISNLQIYGGYSLENLLNYLYTEFAGIHGVDETIQKLVNMYIFDFFTNQTDRNSKNICFEITATRRKDMQNSRSIYAHSLYGRKIMDVKLAPMFDNEKSLKIGKTSCGYDFADNTPEWETACPYSLDDDASGFDVDPNILQLYVNNSKLALPLMERLAYDDEYKKALEKFHHTNSAVFLDPASYHHLTSLFEEKQKELQRVLKF